MATDAAKELKEIGQSARIDIVEYLLKLAKGLRKLDLTVKEQNDALLREARRLGVDEDAAKFFVKGLSDSALRSARRPSMQNIPETTEQGILELETILKNLKTGGKSPRSLNADGGYIGLKDGGEVSLTVIEIPDISGPGVETLFKKR
jgi:hypothetical protein